MSPVTGTASADVGDPFEALYRAEFTRSVQLAHLLTGSNAAAEDIAQDAFLRIRPRLAALDAPAGYLHRTVVNLCRTWHRTHSRRSARERRWLRPVDVAAPAAGEHDELLALIDRLPFRQRAVLVARYWLDLPEAEIAALLGCRPGTVKSLASRALDTLRKDLQ